MLYTRKGDKGTTQFFGDKNRYSKASPIPECLGTLDELNAYLGVCRAESAERGDTTIPVGTKTETLTQILHDIQETLFIIQAEVAGAEKYVDIEKISHLELVTDTIEKTIPPITHFVIPGATYKAARIDRARALARRAERRLIAVHDAELREIQEATRMYINRLSSVLFALTRFLEHTKNASYEAPSYK
jgi:cob(I)alamin adenosyltransferase